MTQHPSPAVDSLTVDTAGSSDAKAAAARRPGRSATHNSSLLLRLFTSQFFDSWLAVSYIFRYPHLVGVQHYLCNELRRFPPAEVEFFLPQLVHLLITRPNESTAVESLLMDMALQSSHVAMTLYWYLQAYLSDLSPNPRTAQFKHCQRIFNQVQELLFTDISPELIIDAPEPVQHAYLLAMEKVKTVVPRPGPLAGLSAKFRGMFRLAPQVQENVYAALVGIASTAASLSAPSLASTMGWVAVAQGQTVKLSEKLGDDYDLLPQPRSLAGRVRGSNALPSRPAASTSRHTRSTPKPLNISIGANGSVQKLAAGGAHWAPASHPTTAGEAYDRAWSSSSAHTGENSASKTDIVQQSQHAIVGSSTPTPARRTSTESCHTVAIMEGLDTAEKTQSRSGSDVEAEAGSSDDTDTGRNSACRSYLDRATRQFQRSARQIGRRLSRSYGGPGELQANKGCKLKAIDAEAMRAGLQGMAASLEQERPKLERRAGYFSSEIKFVTALMDISQRVCAVPKVGRQQFLKAELTLFNHALDHNACVPLWCPDAGGARHHRIVRIPTEDTVVLNSAERAPYLLTLEVLEPSDSDPTHTAPSSPTQRAAARPDPQPTTPLRPTPPACPMPASQQQQQQQQSPQISDSLVEEAASQSSSAQPTPRSSATSQPLSPAVAEDVDEKLMAEVFGDIDDVSGIPDSPLSSEAGRRRSGSYSNAHFGDRSASKRRSWAVSSYTPAAEPAMSNLPHANSYSPHGLAREKQQPPNEAHLALNASSNSAMASRVPTSQEEIRARMRTASILLAQLARQQKALGIKVADLVVPQPSQSENTTNSRSEAADASKRRSKLSNVTVQALVMEEIREKLVREMMQLEELRLKQPGLGSTSDPGAAAADTSRDMDSDINVREVEFKDDPSAKVLKEDWESKKARIRRASPYGRQKNWNLLSVIIKEGADLRQEQLALQLIREMQRIWTLENTNVFVQYYRIMVTGESCGIMETITNTVSVHSIKKEFYSRNPGYAGPPYTLYNYFVTSYGTPDTARFREAQNCFMRSLVAYSLITYILQIRDRHNGNILLDTAGHIIHIDFGFMLYNSPGSVGFEQAPFKFPMEYVDILGGRDSAKFAEFRKLMVTAFLALRKHADNVCLLVEMMIKDSPLPCLGGGPATVTALRERFHLALSEQQIEDLIDNMLVSSCDNITTRMYDAFQYYSNGIL
ncbi:Phosphatidylinositol 4-kinase pik1alpha (PI4-kinase)(PtdIns-4-kinase) [Coemansia sp. RSA 1290]|nr:Phosphatidylinositol 4-kinase pik1alpha (PI4-kinase)(PtdIns-4-kinase) [Coemansia sp. RSA 1290]KAJ2647046.1 Phosphatidylinositol 4-kinase pik1alpha (PI4-kinase)(PtdIns-4-kinase) [Coemansia sp. RSA 1250]